MVKELCWEVMFNFGIFEKGGGEFIMFLSAVFFDRFWFSCSYQLRKFPNRLTTNNRIIPSQFDSYRINELTTNFSSNLRNPQWKNFSY
jgi:hypothetical protein